jgi:hypothetical protein
MKYSMLTPFLQEAFRFIRSRLPQAQIRCVEPMYTLDADQHPESLSISEWHDSSKTPTEIGLGVALDYSIRVDEGGTQVRYSVYVEKVPTVAEAFAQLDRFRQTIQSLTGEQI